MDAYKFPNVFKIIPKENQFIFRSREIEFEYPFEFASKQKGFVVCDKKSLESAYSYAVHNCRQDPQLLMGNIS